MASIDWFRTTMQGMILAFWAIVGTVAILIVK